MSSKSQFTSFSQRDDSQQAANTSRQQNNSSDAVLDKGICYAGQIILVNPETNSCTVRLDHPSCILENCIWVVGSIIAPLMGLSLKTIPPTGARVALIYGSPCYIIQVLPTAPSDHDSSKMKTKTGAFTRKDSGIYGNGGAGSGTLASEILEGEWELSNSNGVGLLFLNNLIQMSAAGRAVVETHCLNDMVRIISENFRHHSAFGDFEIYNDGRLNTVWEGTSYEHESYNLDDPKAPKVTTQGNQVDLSSVQDPVAIYKNRFKLYVGWLGDFIHLFISDPAKTASDILSGKADIKIHNDGTILARSTSEIVFEKAVRVLVPKKLKKWDDPQGDLFKDFDNLPTEPLRTWNYKNPHHGAYQLRQYARYLSNFYSLARFRQLEKDYQVSKESDTPAPNPNNVEPDRQSQSGNVFIEEYSTIRIMRDGSILTSASGGSTVYQGRGHVCISAPKGILIDSGGDIALTGSNIYLKSHNNTEVTAVTGEIRTKGRKGIFSLAEEGPVWIKSDFSDDTKPGIILDSTQANTIINSDKTVVIRSKEGDVSINAMKGAISVVADSYVRIASNKGNIWLEATKDIITRCDHYWNTIKSFFNINSAFKIANSGAVTTRASIFAQNKIQTTAGVYSPPYIGKALGDKAPPPHAGHVHIIEDKFPDIEKTNVDSTEYTNDNNTLTQSSVAVEGMIWEYDNKSYYQYKSDGSVDSLYIPHAQDYIETHTEQFQDSITWTFKDDDKLKSAPRTGSDSLPWPGRNNTQEYYLSFTEGEVLDKPSSLDTWNQTNLTQRPIQRKVRK